MSNFRALFITLISFSLFFMSSCEDDDDPCTSGSFPFLEVGNHLVYYYGPSIFNAEDTVTLTLDSELSDGNYKLKFTAANNTLLNVSYYFAFCILSLAFQILNPKS